MANKIVGTSFHEEIFGTDGDDIIEGLSGYDTLDGGEGSDVYLVNPEDFLGRYVDFYNDSGTTGIDMILATAEGTNIGIGDGFGPNSGIEIIDGLAGSRIVGENEIQNWDFSTTELRGIDEIFGSGGNDNIRGSNADDNISGGEDNDMLFGGKGHDTLNGDTGQDQLFGENGKDSLFGGSGHDLLDGGKGRDQLFGGDGHDQLFGGNGRDMLFGGSGYDTLDGGQGADKYFVGLENDGFVDTYIDTGNKGRDKIIATDDGTVIGLSDGFGPNSGIEVITAGRKDGVTIGGTNDAETWDFSTVRMRGIDGIYAGDGMDIVTGTNHRDYIHGEGGHDQLYGGNGADWMFGGGDSDFIYGQTGNDKIFGEDGNDIIVGGEGNDRLNGGEGYDIFVFENGSGKDRITDFDVMEDLIDFTSFGDDFSYLDLGFKDTKNGVRIEFGEDNHVVLEDVFIEDMHADLFLF